MCKSSKSFTEHNFYCINCGNKGIPLLRNIGFKHEKFHRKKLYCPYCHMEINHVECRDEAETYEFKQLFEEGFFKGEAKDSVIFIETINSKEESCEKYES